MHVLSDDDKRQAVFASMYRYTAEASHLRQRVLQRLVLASLAGSTDVRPFPSGQICENLKLGSSGVIFRAETIRDVLDELQGMKDVKIIRIKKKRAYYLSEAGAKKIDKWAAPSEELFESVIKYLFADSAASLSMELAGPIFRKFTFECFARFGLQIAKTVTGNLAGGEIGRMINSKKALALAIDKDQINAEQLGILEAKCQHFLGSSEPVCERLKFYLCQGYYFAQLVGLEPAGFNPLAEQAFSGAVFYLDTNVLLLGVLSPDEGSYFAEMVNLASRLKIELRVTQATIDELNRVISNRVQSIAKIYNELPIQLLQRTTDEVLKAFEKARKHHPDVTPETFFIADDKITETIQEKLKLILDGRNAAELINFRDVSQIKVTMDGEASTVRGYGKPDLVLEHDAAHFLLVEDERKNNPKTWFLTRDRTLESVAKSLCENEKNPFCFSLVGFLQCISPFVNTSVEETSLSDLMSTFLSTQIRPLEAVFDIAELSLMAEFHADVMSTPPEQLIMAFEFIKSHTLNGLPYREREIPRVSTELRKFLTSDKDTQLRALLQEKEFDRDRLLSYQEQMTTVQDRNEKLKLQLVGLEDNLGELDSTLTTERSETRSRQYKRARKNALIYASSAIVALVFTEQIASLVVQRFPAAQNYQVYLELAIRVLSAFVFMNFPLIFFRKTEWSKNLQDGISIVWCGVSLFIFKVLDTSVVGDVANYLGFATVIVLVFGGFIVNRRGGDLNQSNGGDEAVNTE